MKPPELLGGLNPVATHDWLYGIERMFLAIHYTEEEKVMFVSQMLKGPTGRWWDTASTYFTFQMILKDWQHFKTTFLEKYYHNNLRAQKEREFQLFKQDMLGLLLTILREFV